MPTGPRPDRRRATPAALSLCCLLGCLLPCLLILTSCGLWTGGPDDDRGVTRRGVVQAVDRLLDRRSRAVRAGNREEFLAGVAGDRSFVQAQGEWFDDIAALPVARFDQSVRRRTVRVHDDRATAVVSTTLQLDTYDVVPVVRDARLHFVRDGRRWRVSAVRDPRWERAHHGDLQPWDLGPVDVVEGHGVLGVFDDGSVGRASELVAVVEQAVADVSGVLPVDWSRHVVVYALTDTRVLNGLQGLPGDDPESLDAVAFPVAGRRGEPRLAATRFLLHPRMLEVGPEELARLVRHEIVHVALGTRDDGAPLWLSEGLAEWVSVQPMPESSRAVSGSVLALARSGPRRLPADEGFNDGDVGAHYGLSWWACQTIVDMYGEQALWRLLDALAGAPAADREAILEQTVGLGEARLAAQAAKRIVATYG